jgi:hypothetical protein
MKGRWKIFIPFLFTLSLLLQACATGASSHAPYNLSGNQPTGVTQSNRAPASGTFTCWEFDSSKSWPDQINRNCNVAMPFAMDNTNVCCTTH